MGVTDTELEQGRRMVGSMANVRKANSTSAALFTMPGYVDPIFKATIPLAKQWLQILWGSELPLVHIFQVWRYYRGNRKVLGAGDVVNCLGQHWA